MIENRQYVFTVEGETEYWYLKWLQNQINKCPQRRYNASIKAEVNKSPKNYSKRFTAKSVPQIMHLCDIEGNEQDNLDYFKKILAEMRTVKNQKGIVYILGYSNLTFELWIILHKLDCYAPLSHRKHYLDFIRRAFGEQFEDMKQYKKEDSFNKCLHKLTIEDVKAAIRRAERIMKTNAENKKILNKVSGYSYYPDNPALSVHEIVKKILVECGVINS